MTRRASSASERVRPDRDRSLSILLLTAVAALVVACGGAATSTPPADGSASPAAAATPSDGATTGPSSTDAPSDAPSPSEAPATAVPTTGPSDEPTAAPTATPTGSAATGTASACTGNAENRDFYAAVAAAVDWAVYCPVLPGGWFVDSGQYRLAGGGRMEIGYHGPDGARLSLQQGSFCNEADGCAPDGSTVGDAAFGDRDGSLIAANDGSWAVVVDAGQKPSWLIQGSGMDQAAFTKIAAGLATVGG